MRQEYNKIVKSTILPDVSTTNQSSNVYPLPANYGPAIRNSYFTGEQNYLQSRLNYTSRDATDPFTYKQRFFMNQHYGSLKTNLDKAHLPQKFYRNYGHSDPESEYVTHTQSFH